MMTCREATHLHTDAEEGALSGAKRVFYDLHLQICSSCKRFRAQLRTTHDVLSAIPPETPPEGLVDLLAQEIDGSDG